MDVCARRPARRGCHPAGGVIPPTPNSKGEHPQGHLRHFAGTLQEQMLMPGTTRL